MRGLYKSQQKLLKEFAQDYYNKNNTYAKVDDLPLELWDKLETINNTEVLYSSINTFLWDNRNDDANIQRIF